MDARRSIDPDFFDAVGPSILMPLRFADQWAGMVIRCLEDGPLRSATSSTR